MSLVFHFLKPFQAPTPAAIMSHQKWVKTCDSITVNFVISGRSPPNCLNVPTKTGTRKVTSAISTMPANEMTTVG